MKIISFFLTVFTITFLFINSAYAENGESTSSAQAVKKYKITFPVESLGNCSSLEECKAYCQDLTHKDSCIAFAKERGFYKAPSNKPNTAESAKRNSLIVKAKEILGCDSEESCKAFCSDSTNFAKCAGFAKMVLNGSGKNGTTDSDKHEQASGEGKFLPNSAKAFENANANAKFCREYPEKCKNATGSAAIKVLNERKKEEEKKKLEQKLDIEKKELERKEEKLKKEFEAEKKKINKELEKDKELEDDVQSEVQGVSRSPSLFDSVLRFFFK